MKVFKLYLKIEFKRLLHFISIIVFLSFFALAMYFILDGTNRHQKVLNEKENFKILEQSKVSMQTSYDRYGTYGFRILFVPSPVSIFCYDSGAFTELSSNLDIGERLNITGSYIGQDMFRERGVMYADFFGLHQLFGTLMALFYGFLSFRYREYLKILGSMGGFNKVLFHISSARFLLLALYFIFVTVTGTVLVLLKGVRFTGPDYLSIATYLGLWLLTALVMFSVGMLIGSIKANTTAGAVLVATWICLFYILPLFVNQKADSAANKIKSLYQQESEKWDALMSFENRALKEVGRFKPELAKTTMEQQLIESFINKEYKQMQALEKGMENKMRESIKVNEWWSLSSPLSLLSSVSCEMSSQGFGNLVDFYKYTQGQKDLFCQFYKNKKFYSQTEDEPIESYIKDEENIYYGHAQLPANMLWGLLELLALIILLQGLSFYFHKSIAKRVSGDKAAQWDPASIKPGTGAMKPTVLQIEDEGFNEQIYNLLAKEKEFLYLCHAQWLPGDIRAGDFLDLAALLMGVSPNNTGVSSRYREKQFAHLNNLEKFKVLITITELAERAGKSSYLFHDLTHDMPAEAAVILKNQADELSSRGAWVVFLVRDQLIYDFGSDNSYGVREATGWFEQVEHWANVLKK